jgi:Ca2+-binding RTX toxin-like protein
MGTIDRNAGTRAERFPSLTLKEIFWGPLARRMRTLAHWRARGALGHAGSAWRRRMKFEALEPRLLLSADLAPETSSALADGLSLLGARVDSFVSGDVAFDARVPLLLKLETDPVTGAAANEAPTVGDLLGVPVDANGDGHIGDNFLLFGSDVDEKALQDLDQNHDQTVDAGEFLEGFFFDKVTQFLSSGAPANTQTVVDFLTDSLFPYNLFDPLDQSLHNLAGAYTVDFEVVDAHVADTTENPDAEATFSVGFQLTITHNVPIDLGLEADALKLLPFTNTTSDPKPVEVPVTSTLNFGFDFGVFTGGQTPAQIDGFDFFVRKADPLLASITASDPNFGFKLNVGFLGAQVVNGNFDLQADIATNLLDPNDPDALGFSDSQLGVEHTDGSVTSADAVPSANLAHDVGFFLRVGNIGITTPVSVLDNDAGSLAALKSDIEAALANANLDDLINVDVTGGHVKLSLVVTSDAPLGFANESLSQVGVLDAMPAGDGANSFEYTSDQTFLLSVGGALPHLVTVHFPDPAIEDIGFGETQDADTLPVLVAQAVAPSDGMLSADSTLNITVVTDDGTVRTEAVTVDSDDTDGTIGSANTSVGDLAADINDALPGTISGLIHAFVSGGTKIGFFRLDGSVSAITVAPGANADELGFTAGAATTLALSADNTIQNTNLEDDAHFKIELTIDTGGGTSTMTYAVTVPDNDRGDANLLAADIDAALDSKIGVNRIDVAVSGGKIVLAAHDASVLAFGITTINEDIDDLVADVNHALSNAGLDGMVTASNSGGDVRLTAAGGKSLEISKTLTFDAGVTFAELLPPLFGGTPDSGLFSAGVGVGSHAEFELPVQVNPGLEDVHNNPGSDWDPQEVSIVANFKPLPLDTVTDPVASYNASLKRFDLRFTLDPTMESQDTHVSPVPASGSLTEEIRLVNMAELLNFNLLAAEDMVGLLGGLGTALQQIADSAVFAGYDIPLAVAALSGLLNYTDKKNGTGLIDKLIFDTGGDGIDGDNPDSPRLLQKVTFEGTTYLIPTFVTAQELGAKLDELLPAPLTGDGGINPAYDTETNQLTYSVDLLADSDTTVTIDKPFEYDVSLSPFAKLSVVPPTPPEGTDVTLTGRTGLGMTFGLDLTPPGVVIFPTTPLAELNGKSGIDIQVERALTGEAGVRTLFGISRDSKFKISVDGGTQYDGELLAAAMNNNTSIWDLVGDLQLAIDAALDGSGYEGEVQVGVSVDHPTRLGMQDVAHTIQIYVDSSDPFVTELGFSDPLTSGAPTPFNLLIAQKDAPLLVGRLSGTPTDKATFEIDILKDGFGNPDLSGPVAVEVTVAQMAGNVSPGDLVADVDKALAAAGLGGKIKAAYDNSSVQGTRLVLVVADDKNPLTDESLVEFTVRATNTKANLELGLPNAATAANQADFVIYDRDGNAHPIVLDGLPSNATVDDLIQRINLSFPDPDAGGPLEPLVVASLNDLHTGLKLVTTATTGSEQFRVESVNSSPSLLGMGLFLTGDDALPNTFGDGDPNLIEGGALSQVQLDQRFFVRDAAMRLDGLMLETPDGGVPGEALFGIVGVDTNISGTMYAEVSAALQNPTNEGPADQVSLAQLLKRTGAVDDPVVSKAREIAYTPFVGDIAPGGVVTGALSNATAVVVAVDDAKLILAHVKGSFQDGEGLVQGGNAVIADGADAELQDFGDFKLNVGVQDGFGEFGFGPGFVPLNGASYVVPFELTGFGTPGKPALMIDPVAPAVDLHLSGNIPDLEQFENLTYSDIAHALDGLELLLRDVDANFALLNTKLPAINRSVSDLLSLIDGFAHSVGNADAVLAEAQDVLEQSLTPKPQYEVDQSLDLPAPRLQDIPRLLRGAFGLPNGVNPDDSGAVNWVRFDFDSGSHMLEANLSLEQALSTKLGLDIVVGGGLPNLTSGGVLEVAGLLDVNLHFGIDLDTPANAYLYDDSNISASLDVVGEGQQYAGGEDGLGLVFYSSIGPLSVFIQDGDANIHVAFDLPMKDLGSPHRKLLDSASFGDFDAPSTSQDTVDIALPMFYGGEGPNDYLGQFKATGSLGAGLTITTPNFEPLADKITSETIPFDPFDNIQLAVDTLDVYLQGLTDDISSSVLNTRLPFAGDQLADVLFIEEFRNTLVRALKEGIANAVNPDPDTFVQGLLEDIFGPGGALHAYLKPGTVVGHNENLGGPVDTRYRQWNVTLQHAETVNLSDFDIGIPGLTFDVDTPVTVNFDWTMDLVFGVDFGHGAYIDVSDAQEIDLKLDITLPGGPHDGQLGFLRMKVSDPGNDTGAHVEFHVDVQNGNGGDRLAFADLGNVLPVATVEGGALEGESDAVTLHLVTQTAFGLPTLSADLLLDWTLLTDTPVDSLNGDGVTPGIGKIALDNIVLDAASVAEQLLGPLFGDVKQFIDPFMPVVDTLTAPIPILSDIAGEPFTLLDLAGIFGVVDPRFLDTVADVLDVINAINGFLNAPELPLGDLTLYDLSGGISNFDPNVPGALLADVGSLLDSLGLGTPGLVHDTGTGPGTYNYLIEHNPFLKAVKDGTLADGLKMPILVDPLQGIKLLLGDPTATILEYPLKPLTVGFDYTQVFPVWGPLAVAIEISFEFTLDLHSVGFDTYGYKRYADGGFRNPAVIFDGFFLNDRDENNVDAPEITMGFGLVGAAELNLGVASAGVKGGIDATIFFDWHDSIPDGHVHLSEIAGNVVSNGGNPLAAFDVGGELTFQMFVFLKILSFEKDFPITPETTLYSFEDTSSRDPILATDLGGGVLQLNMGPNAKDRLNGDVSDGNEEFFVRNLGGGDVKVWSTKLGVGDSPGQVYHGVTHIVGLGGQGDDKIHLLDFDGSGITGDFDGGVGDDYIAFEGSSASTSAPGSRIVGGLGNDTLIGGDANDVIIGGQGSDTIEGGGGHDILFGDTGTVTETYITSRIGADDGADSIKGGAGDDVLIGAGGDDMLDGGEGADVIIGDGGRFSYTKTGSGDAAHIDVAALRPDPYVPTPISSYKDPAEISREIDALYDVMAQEFIATDLGFGGNDDIHGGDGGDLILAGSGDDVVHGDGGDDVILGGKGFDDLHGGSGKDLIFGGDQADTISGDDGDDVISGGSGGDFIHGNDGDDVMKGDTGADVMFGDAGDDQVFGQTEPDVLFGGIGNDLVVGGTGNDIMFGDDGVVAKLDPTKTDGSGNTRIIGIGSVDFTGAFRDDDIRTLDLIETDVVAGDGNDVMSGDAGDDIMLGGGGNDLMGGDVDPRLPSAGVDTSISEDVLIGDGGKITFDQRYFRSIETVIGDETGAPFDDIIYGDNGNDYIFGGRGSDLLFGGHGKVVTDVTAQTLGDFRGVTDAAADDNDIIVGDNGEMLFAQDSITHKSGVLSVVRTTDTTDATGGHEYAEGELGDDVIFGGANASVDVLFGNAGNDVILGDNGELNWDLDGLGDLSTLDLIRSYRDGVGGEDHISGNAGDDVLIGGTGGDQMYGDDADASAGTADGEDIMLGDNADIFLIGNVGRLKVRVADMGQGTAVDRITTTDDSDDYGGADTMSGNAKADVMLGGVNHGGTDLLYGDRAAPNPTTIANDGDDILLGDNGELDFDFDETHDRSTLDLIRSYQDGLGGSDEISGDKGLDVAIGGTAGDVIYGDDAAHSANDSDLGDLLLGDNADIFLVAPGGASGGDLKLVLDAAVKTIRTTDEEHPEYGGIDIISGNAGGDIIAGGVAGDTLYGDRASPTMTTSGNDGDDIILGDNGAFEWLSTGRLSQIHGIDIETNNAALYAKYHLNVADTDLTTLDLITTEQPTSGGRDSIYGDEGSDLVFGGTDLDIIYGDDGNGVAETGAANQDVLFGDHGRLYPQFSALSNINSRNFFAIDTGNADGGEGDIMYGEEGDDVMLGQQGDDRMWGGSGDDDMTGGHNVSGGYDEISLPAVQATLNPPMNDLMDGGSGDDAMAGDNAIIWRRGDDVSPRFRMLTEAAIYTTGPDGSDSITTNVGTVNQSDPNGAVGRDIELLDHADTTASGLYGADVMAGGADSDVMFGQLGNDLMQGDGNIGDDDMDPDFVTRHLTVTDSGMPDTSEELYFNVPEQASDGDDYMEGNGGDDLMYGGLGQDDMIGGSSALFGLAGPETLRPDGSDIMFGGAGAPARIARNDFVGATDTDHGTAEGVGGVPTDDDPSIALADRHSRDADFIMGDNANVFRLVNGSDQFLQFNYDQSSTFENRGTGRIVVRAMQQLDYTLGGADYAGGAYTAWGAANSDNGAADLIHGESGDDVIFGMTGSDVIFGESDDDDIVGGYGNDWISGGTGQDGVIGDDGLIYTSRNSTLGEPLYGIEGLLASDANAKYNNGDALNELISTPGDTQIATINIEGQLKKTADLVPFSFDKSWVGMDDEFPNDMTNKPYADDIIFGGLGSDFLHGGSGDDAISGAEALEHAYVPTFDAQGNSDGVLDLGYNAFDLALPVNPGDSVASPNPGNVLAFNSVDLDGQHLNNRFRAGEFFLYDEYDPLRRIELNSIGELWKPGDAGPSFEFLLNFDQTEGIFRASGTVPKATGQQTDSYGEVNDDGKDSIFGDLGNDWLVGGTGRDDMYGGWGNDLLNADDDLSTVGDAPKHGDPEVEGANDRPDTHPYYEDRAYGGAGRDVLIGNTGGDRLIDWVGEYNSFLVPYAPFGQASVSRTLMPHLQEFLYALSAGDGADPTRYADAIGGEAPAPTNNDPIPSRNGEPFGELGMVLQKDFAWGDQTGAPADPQAGNIPGGKRDVLRSAGFNDGTPSGFAVDSGSFAVVNGKLSVSAASLGLEATAVLPLDDQLPGYYEVLATVSVEKPTAGWKANSYIVFDYFDADDFKFAGINASTNEVEIGYHDAAGWHVVKDVPKQLKAGTSYNMMVAINGTNVTLVLDNKSVLSYTFAPRVIDDYAYGLNLGLVGLGSDNSRGTFDNFTVQRVPPEWTLQQSQSFASGTGTMLGGNESGTWTLAGGRYAAAGPAATLVDLGLSRGLETDAVLELSATLSTSGAGGLVFDRYAVDDYKFVVLDAEADQVIVGHVSPKGGLTIDASFARTINAGTDYTLTLRLKGTSVSVSVGGQAVGGFVYNAVVVDGDFGLLAERGGTSFASATVKTSDSAFYVPQSAMLATATAEAASGPTLTQSELDTIAQFAISAWTDVLGAGSGMLTALADVRFGVADLIGAEIGFTEGNTVLIDADAAGFGWFVDASPASSSEFRVRLDSNIFGATPGSAAYGHMDLVTVVEHEIGHVLGFEHADAGAYAVMQETLAPGVRYALEPAPVEPVSAAFEAFAGYADASAGADAGIDWQARFDSNWEVTLSPYDTGKPAKGASSIAPFNLDLLAKLGAQKQGAEFDRMGRELLGKRVGG